MHSFLYLFVTNLIIMRFVYVLFCFCCLNAFGQVNHFQIELVNENIGASLTESPSFYSNESNDDGLNQIFETYNVGAYETIYPSYGLPEPYWSEPARFNEVICDSCDAEAFLNALNAYSSVVKYASQIVNSNDGIINNVLSLNLVDQSIGFPNGFNGDIVTTNDNGLNSIFMNYNVRTYDQLASDVNYGLVCSCDAIQLKAELESYSSIISFVEHQYATFLLSTEESELKRTEIYPNPFTNKIELRINANTELKTIEVYDVLGKRVLETKDKMVFESKAVAFKSGIYILKLITVGGQIETKKLIKQ